MSTELDQAPHERSTGAFPEGASTEQDAAARVQSMFDTIAPSYDRLNHILSAGLDAHWWRRAASTFAPVLARPQAQVLDICCGTGDMTAALLALRPDAVDHIAPMLGLDFSAQMLDLARIKYSGQNVRFLEGDAMHLPFADDSFDLVTSAFGFRNLTNSADGLAEIYRVLRPGGQIGILECNQPDGLAGLLYNVYFRHILPTVGGMLSGSHAAYRYLPASVARFPRPPRMLKLLSEAGFRDAAWDGYTLHAAGLYRATKH
jgi:demethylmenaquinone methyltransferase/2-methoxy-6-polyprenyl-1,4-benzoquinol methylase